MDDVSREWLERIGSFVAVECVRVFQVAPNGSDIVLVSQWREPGLGTPPTIVFSRDFPWIVSRVIARQPVIVPSLAALPADAVRDRDSLIGQGYNAVLVMPLLAGEHVVGALAFGSVAERAWANETVANVRLMSEVLAHALARRRTDDALRASEVMKSGILDSLTSGVAVIDADGRLLDVNANWMRLVEASRMLPHAGLRVGDNLLELVSSDTSAGLKAVLDGSNPRFGVESAALATAGTRWWSFVATRLNRLEGGAVVTLTEITERRRAEIEARQSRQALAHVERVSTIGELTASLAHQLSQPLTGILSNAQASRRLLEHVPTDLQELRAATSDIVEDARRAGEVVQRMRELLRRGELNMTSVDLCAVIRDVVKLIDSDAIIRKVTVALELDAQPLVVRGDRVQLQQLILNLLINGLEAIDDRAVERVVRVRCHRTRYI